MHHKLTVQPQRAGKGKTMATTTKSFDEFFEALSEAYAMEIDETIVLPAFEEKEDGDLGNVVVLYDEWNGSITIPYSRNPLIDFDSMGRTYSVKGFSSSGSVDSIETFNIRFLELA